MKKSPNRRKESPSKKNQGATGEYPIEKKLLYGVLFLLIAVLLLNSYSVMNTYKALQSPPGNNPGLSADLTSVVDDFLTSKTDKTMKGSIAVQSLKDGTAVVLDVRTDTFRKNGYIADSRHIPLKELTNRLSEVPKNEIIIVYCQNNINASYGAAFLNMQGYNAYVLEGGIDAWISAGGETTMLSPPKKSG